MVVVLLVVPVSAQISTSPYASLFFSEYDTYIVKSSSVQMKIWFDVIAVRTMDELGVNYIKIQRSQNGTNWETMKEYYPYIYTKMIGYDITTISDYLTYTGTPGWYYRAYVVFYAKNYSGGIAEVTQYSEIFQL
jgi:hypothetical protein